MLVGLCLGALVALYFAAALTLTWIPANSEAVALEDGLEIFLVSNGVHVDIVLPVNGQFELWRSYFEGSDLGHSILPSDYLAFGWGERNFFLKTPTWDDLTLGVAVPAVFWPTATAMHVTRISEAPRVGDSVRALRVDPENYGELIQYVRSGFRSDPEGRPVAIDCCSYAGVNDAFFEGTGSYQALRTCNVWTNNGIKQAGLRTAYWAPFEWSVLHHFHLLEGDGILAPQ